MFVPNVNAPVFIPSFAVPLPAPSTTAAPGATAAPVATAAPATNGINHHQNMDESDDRKETLFYYCQDILNLYIILFIYSLLCGINPFPALHSLHYIF